MSFFWMIPTRWGIGRRPELDAGETVFDRAKRALRRVAQSVAEMSGGDPVTLLTTSDPGRPVCAVSGLAPEHLRELRGRVGGGGSCRRLRLRWGMHLRRSPGMVGDAPSQVNVTVYVTSDFQGVDWVGFARRVGDDSGEGESEPSEPAEASGLTSPVAPLGAPGGGGGVGSDCVVGCGRGFGGECCCDGCGCRIHRRSWWVCRRVSRLAFRTIRRGRFGRSS